MIRSNLIVCGVVFGLLIAFAIPAGAIQKFEEARIYMEFNSTDNDLGFHVSLDGEDWKWLRILNPEGITIFAVQGQSGYKNLGLTELFFEGAEPSLDDFPLADLLALFPEGVYSFIGQTVEGESINRLSRLSYAVPSGPSVSSHVGPNSVTIRWEAVTGPPQGFPQRAIQIEEYQVIVDSFQVNLPSTANKVTLPREFVETLESGDHGFEVLAIDAKGNQTITAGSFRIP